MLPLTALEELALLLKPAGAGVHVVSSGKAEQLAMQKRLYRADSEAEIQRQFLKNLEKLSTSRIFILGCPSDVGAGLVRGANMAPAAIRSRLLRDNPDWPEESDARGIVDIGDVFIVPQLLHDDMLSPEQLEATRRALYPNVSLPLPVSPLSKTHRVLQLVFQLNPNIKPFVLGGDHSCAWPVALALSENQKSSWGIVQPDAHTDLLSERLGIRYCFATWSYHANDLLGRQGKLVQVGTRASGKPQSHWESTLGVRQFWAHDVLANPQQALEQILAHVRSTGVKSIYFSNDIDGTDSRFADATGTPEPDGLTPDFLVELIRRLGQEVGMCAADVMEVAPLVQRTPHGGEQTVALAVRYMMECLKAMELARPFA